MQDNLSCFIEHYHWSKVNPEAIAWLNRNEIAAIIGMSAYNAREYEQGAQILSLAGDAEHVVYDVIPFLD